MTPTDKWTLRKDTATYWIVRGVVRQFDGVRPTVRTWQADDRLVGFALRSVKARRRFAKGARIDLQAIFFRQHHPDPDPDHLDRVQREERFTLVHARDADEALRLIDEEIERGADTPYRPAAIAIETDVGRPCATGRIHWILR